MNIKKCPVCSSRFTGRSDKKFCCDQCRNAFNNKANSIILKEIRKTNKILRSNREILLKYNAKGKENVSLFSLISEGFILTYFTNIHKNEDGEDVFFCYDVGYQLSDNEFVKVFTKTQFEKSLTTSISR